MNESKLGLESVPEMTREEALAAYKKFVERGVTSPDTLDLEDPEVIEANALFDRWQTQEDRKAEGDRLAEQKIDFEKTMFYIDAGFVDRGYLEEVLGWLAEDGMSVNKLSENEENKKNVSLRKDIADAIHRIRKMLD